ncbi:Hypothetical protein KVN_LOCUS76 [uncultured virus]|nr:Hypothetical protein KVN_LOCUS76 [uncultured virus]
MKDFLKFRSLLDDSFSNNFLENSEYTRIKKCLAENNLGTHLDEICDSEKLIPENLITILNNNIVLSEKNISDILINKKLNSDKFLNILLSKKINISDNVKSEYCYNQDISILINYQIKFNYECIKNLFENKKFFEKNIFIIIKNKLFENFEPKQLYEIMLTKKFVENSFVTDLNIYINIIKNLIIIKVKPNRNLLDWYIEYLLNLLSIIIYEDGDPKSKLIEIYINFLEELIDNLEPKFEPNIKIIENISKIPFTFNLLKKIITIYKQIPNDNCLENLCQINLDNNLSIELFLKNGIITKKENLLSLINFESDSIHINSFEKLIKFYKGDLNEICDICFDKNPIFCAFLMKNYNINIDNSWFEKLEVFNKFYTFGFKFGNYYENYINIFLDKDILPSIKGFEILLKLDVIDKFINKMLNNKFLFEIEHLYLAIQYNSNCIDFITKFVKPDEKSLEIAYKFNNILYINKYGNEINPNKNCMRKACIANNVIEIKKLQKENYEFDQICLEFACKNYSKDLIKEICKQGIEPTNKALYYLINHLTQNEKISKINCRLLKTVINNIDLIPIDTKRIN